jgi:antitoxin component YwqK of YwqJK toxin-antitoxin module
MKNIPLFLFMLIAKFYFSQSHIYNENPKKQNGDVEYIYCFKKGYSNNSCNIFPEYIPQSKLYDWRNSIIKIDKNDTKFIDNLNNYASGSYFVVEHCILKNGIKNGPFTLSICYLKNVSGKISVEESTKIIESGEFLDGNYNGVIKSLNLVNTQEGLVLNPYDIGVSSKKKLDYVNINYSGGNIGDQKITFQNNSFGNQIIDEGILTDFFGEFTPWVEFQGGKVKQILTLNGLYNLPVFKIIDGETTTVFCYSLTPVCWNWFSFFSDDDRKKNKEKPFVDFGNKSWNKKQLFMEVYSMNNKNFEISGKYKLYYGFNFTPPQVNHQTEFFKDITNQNIQDTVGCKIAAYYSYKNGKRNGKAIVFGGNGSIAYKISFKDDLLHGESSHYFNDGKTAFIVNFNRGLPEGEAISYFNPSSKVPLLSVPVKSEHLIGGVFLPQSVIKWNEEKSIQSMTQTIKDNGGKISQLNSYQMISKVNYQIDSIKSNTGSWERFSHPDSDYSILNNGKPMRKHKIDFNSTYKSKIVDWDYLDQDGKVVFNKAQEDEAKNEQSNKEIQEKQQENKRLEEAVKKCSYCGKDYTGKTHLATYDDKKYQCDEYEVSNYKEWTKIFCSAKCALEYCRKTKY